MTNLEAIVLGVVQGLTEFLPISSTAHLRIVPALLGWSDPGAAYSAVIQCGTLAAVVFAMRRDISALAGGLLTPLAAAGVIGIMVVAIVVAHAKVGFFVFLPNQGWEYCATIAIGAAAVGIMGPGDWSVDNGIDFVASGWDGALITLAVGVGGAVLQLASSYRPKPS